MNAQLKYTMARERRTRLRHAKPMSDCPAVWRHARLNVDNYPRARGVFGHGGCGLGARVWARLVVVAVALSWFGASAALADPVGQVREFSTGPNTMPRPEYVAPGADGNLWFTETSLETGVTSVIGRITPSGQITEFSAGLANSEPMGIAPAPDGNMWFTDGYNHAIGRITLSGQITEYSAGLNANNDVVGIAPGADGNMWFTDEFGAIGRITPSGQITEYSAGLNPGSEPMAIAPGPDGNLWFADEGATPAIGRITPSGQITEYSAGLNPGGVPSGIAVGPDGNLWFTDDGATHAIGRITPSGQITEYTNGLNPFTEPGSIAAGPDGNLWFADESRGDRAGHPVGADHRVFGRPEPGQPADRDRPGVGRQHVVHRPERGDRADRNRRCARAADARERHRRRAGGKPRGLPGAMGRLGRVHGADRAVSLRWLRVAARRQLDPGPDNLRLHPDRRRRRPPARLSGDRHLPAAVPAHRDRHQPGDHHPGCPAPTLDTGALSTEHLAWYVHAQRAPGRGTL